MTMPITLTGPDTCAQCGSQIDTEAVLAEAAATGTSEVVTEAYVVIRGHRIPVPGLYWDRSCGSRIESGELESTLTLEAAQAFLNDVWGPSVVEAGLKATMLGRDEMASRAARRLVDVMEVSLILETIVAALDEGSDLS